MAADYPFRRILSKARPHGIRQQTVHLADINRKPLGPLCGVKLKPRGGLHSSLSGWEREQADGHADNRPCCKKCWSLRWRWS
jgi:hypothetical protein